MKVLERKSIYIKLGPEFKKNEIALEHLIEKID